MLSNVCQRNAVTCGVDKRFFLRLRERAAWWALNLLGRDKHSTIVRFRGKGNEAPLGTGAEAVPSLDGGRGADGRLVPWAATVGVGQQAGGDARNSHSTDGSCADIAE